MARFIRRLQPNQKNKTQNRSRYARKSICRTKTLEKVGDVLGVSGQSVHDEMKRLNIPRLPKGHRGFSPCLKALYDLGNVSGLTYPEIAKIINFSGSRVYFLLHKYKIPYQRKKGLNE